MVFAPVLAAPDASPSDLESVDVVIRMLEHLAAARGPVGVSEIARRLGLSKPRAHRHLRALLARGYARQDPRSEGYEVGVRLLELGEDVRERFDAMTAVRPFMAPLRDATGLAVTASALMGDEVVVLDMLQGKTLVEFTIRPGSRLSLHASAHGLSVLAFGPRALQDLVLKRPLEAFTAQTIADAETLRRELDLVRRRGWSTAPDAVQLGVNALAAPLRDHHGVARGAVAIVGATQAIPANPPPRLIETVAEAAEAASRSLGWRRATDP